MQLEEMAMIGALGYMSGRKGAARNGDEVGLSLRQGKPENDVTEAREECFKKGVLKRKSVFSKVNCY